MFHNCVVLLAIAHKTIKEFGNRSSVVNISLSFRVVDMSNLILYRFSVISYRNIGPSVTDVEKSHRNDKCEDLKMLLLYSIL